ncbi:hypothetical protein DRQ15_05570 [candidate division KSB1 bacterium]|nr:MAG: hypothetical protein DRQ15_05570 [candidate division KSB1 bacterium]
MTRSDHHPDATFSKLAVASATPSIIPMEVMVDCNTFFRNKGRIGRIISEETSVKKLTHPSILMVRGIFSTNFSPSLLLIACPLKIA